ncbi:hypothetical protein CC86DRAFT_405375 [Ophiobolus disseminans]|uniref:Uncharacterized protein n=1 Tax=Ophiobolus disseminans TaxID=1469910 RepID=A0A6A7A359_9PLEO|nr:hypothetical protein CC86DRAFT_405375 [Ophiobolus disseminans]
MAQPVTGRSTPASLLLKLAVPLYTSGNAVPPPQAVINVAAVLAAVLQLVIPDLEPQLDDMLRPIHEPYGESTFVALSLVGAHVDACVVDVWNAYKDSMLHDFTCSSDLSTWMDRASLHAITTSRLT